ncbi:hypothetical protein [Rhodopila sp.]|uniref:hypothetical protein n=1 Tax=Rhodopila sp. TaxID=2480087 RepID=UPI003D0C422E
MTQSVTRRRSLVEPVDPPSEDVGWAIRSLSDTDVLRLHALASLRARGLPGGVTGSDLLNEAILRALDGSRQWPAAVPMVAFLAGIMRSLRDEHWRRTRREGRVMQPLPADDAGLREHPNTTPDADPERVYAAAQALAVIDRLFAADETALRIVAGLAHGLGAEDIRRLYGLSELEYDTARRRMRRSLLRHGLAGSGR